MSYHPTSVCGTCNLWRSTEVYRSIFASSSQIHVFAFACWPLSPHGSCGLCPRTAWLSFWECLSSFVARSLLSRQKDVSDPISGPCCFSEKYQDLHSKPGALSWTIPFCDLPTPDFQKRSCQLMRSRYASLRAMNCVVCSDTGNLAILLSGACNHRQALLQVTLISSDNESFQVPKNVAIQSLTIKNTVDGRSQLPQ